MVARSVVEESRKKKVNLLSLAESKNVRLIARGLKNRGYIVDNRGLQEPLPVSQDVISFA